MKCFMYGTQETIVVVGGSNCADVGYKTAENSRSYDFGIEKSINPNFFIDLSYFNIKYRDALEGWTGNNAAGSGSTTQNSSSTTESQGLEFLSNFKLNEMLNFGLNYTYTQTYDGAEHDNPNNKRDKLSNGQSSKTYDEFNYKFESSWV